MLSSGGAGGGERARERLVRSVGNNSNASVLLLLVGGAARALRQTGMSGGAQCAVVTCVFQWQNHPGDGRGRRLDCAGSTFAK